MPPLLVAGAQKMLPLSAMISSAKPGCPASAPPTVRTFSLERSVAVLQAATPMPAPSTRKLERSVANTALARTDRPAVTAPLARYARRCYACRHVGLGIASLTEVAALARRAPVGRGECVDAV